MHFLLPLILTQLMSGFSLSLTSSPSSGLFLAPIRFDIQKDIAITNLTTVFRGRISLVDVCGPVVLPPMDWIHTTTESNYRSINKYKKGKWLTSAK